MCFNFTILNKACPKDEYPLLRIDTLIDVAAGSEMLSMLDCFSMYHQIFMNKSDEEKTMLYHPLRHILLCENARGPPQRRLHHQ